MTPQRQYRLREQLRRSRARLLVRDAPIAMVLMYLRFVATKKVQRISTDGIGDYPPEEDALGIPVLWILYGDAPFPSWGKQARIKNKS